MFAHFAFGFEAAACSALLTTLTVGVFSLYCVAGCAKKNKEEGEENAQTSVSQAQEAKIAFDLSNDERNNSLTFVKTEIAFPNTVQFRSASAPGGAAPKAGAESKVSEATDEQDATKETKETKESKAETKETKTTEAQQK